MEKNCAFNHATNHSVTHPAYLIPQEQSIDTETQSRNRENVTLLTTLVEKVMLEWKQTSQWNSEVCLMKNGKSERWRPTTKLIAEQRDETTTEIY